MKDLKHGDKVFFTNDDHLVAKEGTFIGYSPLMSSYNNVAMIETISYEVPYGTKVHYSSQFSKKPEPKKRLMTAKELLGGYVSLRGEIVMVTCTRPGEKEPEAFELATRMITNAAYLFRCGVLFSRTPMDDSSWKSVEVDV